MGFFGEGEDPFEDIFSEFFGRRGFNQRNVSQNVVGNESEERVIDYIEEDDLVYFVFELPGYSEKDVNVILKGDNLIISAKKNDFKGVKDYLKGKLSQETSFSKKIPVKVKKELKKTFNNGVLEVELIRR